MAVRTHDSKWRLLVGGAPLLGVAFVVLAALQGEPGLAQSVTVMEVLAVIAALGGLVAWWTGYQLLAAPAVAVALAQAGQVALKGRAQALPGAAPLLSPDGVPCLWFKHSHQAVHQYNASDSVQPFLLADGTGQCMVLPEGADITGSSKAAGGSDTRERLLLEGDEIHVVGWLATGSTALPTVGKSSGASPFIISIASRDGQAGLYGFLAAVNGIILCAAAGNFWWLAR